jgi:ubiquitin carboxyl-terminal hydrolase 48
MGLIFRAVKLKQRQNHEKLISGKSFTLNLGKKYYLVPSSWLSEWRAYIIATGKNVSSLSEPFLKLLSIHLFES